LLIDIIHAFVLFSSGRWVRHFSGVERRRLRLMGFALTQSVQKKQNESEQDGMTGAKRGSASAQGILAGKKIAGHR
jgi:hypothetical protein